MDLEQLQADIDQDGRDDGLRGRAARHWEAGDAPLLTDEERAGLHAAYPSVKKMVDDIMGRAGMWSWVVGRERSE